MEYKVKVKTYNKLYSEWVRTYLDIVAKSQLLEVVNLFLNADFKKREEILCVMRKM